MKRNVTFSLDEDLVKEFRVKVLMTYGTTRNMSAVIEMLMRAYLDMGEET